MTIQTPEEFAERIQRLEEDAARNPGFYRLRVAGLSALGYGYLGLIAIGALLVVPLLFFLGTHVSGIGYVIGKASIALIALVVLLIRALWVELPEPEGLELSRRDAPRLHALIDELRRELGAPAFHHVLLDNSFNAGVTHVPRFGMFGGDRNFLILGLPLLLSLEPERLRAVLAHEFGHLSGGHGRFGAWIYRQRRTWTSLLETLEAKQHWGTGLFKGFVEWYAPYFNAYSFVLARATEYEADQGSAQAAGARTAGDALIAIELRGRFLSESFWPSILKRADDELMPPEPYRLLSPALLEASPSEQIGQWLDEALARPTDYADTHPGLADRLAALKRLETGSTNQSQPSDPRTLQLQLVALAGRCAAEDLLGDALPPILQGFDRSWRESVRGDWQKRHREVGEARAALASLEERFAREPLNEDEAWERVQRTLDLRGLESAQTLVREFAKQYPDHLMARFQLAQLLLTEDDPDGLRLLDSVMEQDPNAILPGCQLAWFFLHGQGRAEEAERYRRRAMEHQAQLEAASAERDRVGSDDVFVPHGLEPGALAAIRKVIGFRPGLKEVLLVRKQVEHHPESPVHVVGILRSPKERLFSRREDAQQMVEDLARDVPVPGSVFVVLLDRDRGLRYRMRKVEGAVLDLEG